ncbi:MAG TPA: MC/SLC25 family protein [Rhabdochlamydiaceae bacterium]|nr:MC/SLC25 family protein [Rhabdochlamydiaceae bacterium]
MFIQSVGAVFIVNSMERTLSQPLKTVEVTQQSNPKLGLIQAVKQIYSQKGCRGFYAGYFANLVSANLKGARWLFYKGGYHVFEELAPNHPSIVAGCVAVTNALGEAVLGCPCDNWMKLRMTGNPRVWKTLKAEGIGCLFRGFQLSFFIACGSLTTYLVSFQYFKQLMLARSASPSTGEQVAISAASGTVSRLVHAPLETLLTQSQKENPRKERKLRSFIQEHGVQRLYRGLIVQLMRSNCYAVVTWYLMHKMEMLPKQMKLT